MADKTKRSISLKKVAALCAARRRQGCYVLAEIFRCDKTHSEADANLYHAPDLHTLRRFINDGANVNVRHCLTMETPLHSAVIARKGIFWVREFLKHGADVNAADFRGLTPLHFAVKFDQKVIPELIHCGADINLKCLNVDDLSENSPLNKAVDNLQCAKLMIKHTLLKHFEKDYQTVIDLEPFQQRATYEELSSYLNDCVSDIINMKSIKLNGNITLFEWIKSTLNSNEQPVFSSEIHANAVCKILHSEKQRHYARFKSVIAEGIGRRNLVNKLSEQYTFVPLSAVDLCGKGKIVTLDLYSVFQIVSYLSNEELLNYLIAFYAHSDDTDKIEDSQKKHDICVKQHNTRRRKRLNDLDKNDAYKVLDCRKKRIDCVKGRTTRSMHIKNSAKRIKF